MRLNLRKDMRDEPAVVQPTTKRAPVEKSTRIPAAGNLLRDRGRKPQADLGDIWSSKNIEDHVEVDDFDEQAARIRQKIRSVSQRSQKFVRSRKAPKPKATKAVVRPVRPVRSKHIVTSSNASSSLDMVQSRPTVRPQTSPQSSKTKFFRARGRRLLLFINRRKRTAVFMAVGSFALIFGLNIIFGRSTSDQADVGQKDALGASVTSEEIQSVPSKSGPDIVNNTEFELLTPADKDQSSFEVALVSPPENEPVYAYIDKIEEVEIRISQQKMPESFAAEQETKLADVAKDFQATNIIQIDEMKVYHGFTEKFGGVQSLVFIKKDVMVFISSAKKLSDDTWAGYILSLQ